MNTEYFRNLINLLESIEKVGELPHQVDEAFGISKLPSWVPGSAANKQRKADDTTYKASQQQYKQEREQLKDAALDITTRIADLSHRTPVLMTFYNKRGNANNLVMRTANEYNYKWEKFDVENENSPEYYMATYLLGVKAIPGTKICYKEHISGLILHSWIGSSRMEPSDFDKDTARLSGTHPAETPKELHERVVAFVNKVDNK